MDEAGDTNTLSSGGEPSSGMKKPTAATHRINPNPRWENSRGNSVSDAVKTRIDMRADMKYAVKTVFQDAYTRAMESYIN